MHFLSGFSLIPEFLTRGIMQEWQACLAEVKFSQQEAMPWAVIIPWLIQRSLFLLSSLVRKLAIFSLSQKKILPWSTFHIPWYWWELGSLGMIPNCVHTWGFRHTGMGWRSQQTLNCKGDECLRTWKQKRTSYGETDSAKGLGIEGDQHFH